MSQMRTHSLEGRKREEHVLGLGNMAHRKQESLARGEEEGGACPDPEVAMFTQDGAGTWSHG